MLCSCLVQNEELDYFGTPCFQKHENEVVAKFIDLALGKKENIKEVIYSLHLLSCGAYILHSLVSFAI